MTKKTKGRRYGLGEYELPSDDKYSMWAARADFLRTIDDIEPRVAISLFEKAFDLFVGLAWTKFPNAMPEPLRKWRDKESNFSFTEALFEAIKPVLERTYPNFSQTQIRIELLKGFEDYKVDEIREVFPNWRTLKKEPQAKELCKVIRDWSKDWNLNEDWCHDFALTTLCVWLQDKWKRFDKSDLYLRSAVPEMLGDKLWDESIDSWILSGKRGQIFHKIIENTVKTEMFEFNFKGIEFSRLHWNPLNRKKAEWKRETSGEFQAFLETKRIEGVTISIGTLTRFREHLKKYLIGIEKAADEAGLEKTPCRWAKQHFVWAVYFQVLEYSMPKLEIKYLTSRATLSVGINTTLDLIKLKRRPDLPGGVPKGARLLSRRRTVRN